MEGNLVTEEGQKCNLCGFTFFSSSCPKCRNTRRRTAIKIEEDTIEEVSQPLFVPFNDAEIVEFCWNGKRHPSYCHTCGIDNCIQSKDYKIKVAVLSGRKVSIKKMK